MELRVDGVVVHRGQAKLGSAGLAMLAPPLTPATVSALSTGHKLQVITVLGVFEYSLAGSADAIEAATKCVAHFNSAPATASIGGPSARSSSGTGFVVSARGHVMTNAHVVKSCSALEVGLPGAPLRPASVIARDDTNDLALLSSTLTSVSVPSLRPVVRTGEAIAVYGFPLAGLLPSTGNFTVGNITAVAGLRDDTSMLQISAHVQLGSSGGPVLDQWGNVVGVIVSKMDAIAAARITSDIPQNVNFAIKSAVALTFLQSNGVEPLSATSSTSLDPADLADRAKSFTVFVACSARSSF